MFIKEKDKAYIKVLTLTALPVVLQNLLQNSLSFADTIMIGQLGEVSIASVGLANQLYFFINCAVFGLSSGTSVFTSQFWGTKNKESIQKVMGCAFVFGFVLTFLLACLSIFLPDVFLGIYTNEQNVINQGCVYLKIVGISYIFVASSQVISAAIRSTGDTKTPMIITMLSMISNVILNYLLIFSFSLGVAGAAIATAFSRFLEVVLLFYCLQHRSQIPFSAKTGFCFTRTFATKVLKVSFPVIVDDSIWAFGFMIYKVIYSRMGVSVLACTNISEAVQDLLFIVSISLGAASSIHIGNEIGKTNYDKAKYYAIVCMKFAVLSGLLCTVLMALCSLFVPALFNVSEHVRNLAKLSILAMSISLPVKFFNHATICGIIRSGGDTKFMLIAELITIYLIGVPIAFLSGVIWGFPIYIVYIFVALEEIAKLSVFLPRVLSGKWIHNLTK